MQDPDSGMEYTTILLVNKTGVKHMSNGYHCNAS